MGEEFVPLRRKLDELDNDNDRIAYLENYLRENKGIPLGLLAAIYEWLGELHTRQGRPRGAFFEKAAGTWEMIAVLEMSDEGLAREIRRDSFREALRIYKLARESYKLAGSWENMRSVESKISLVREELRKHGGPAKVAAVAFVAIIFFASFVLLSGPPTTGFVVYPLMEEDAMTFTGMGLAVLGIAGALFVLWWWR